MTVTKFTAAAATALLLALGPAANAATQTTGAATAGRIAAAKQQVGVRATAGRLSNDLNRVWLAASLQESETYRTVESVAVDFQEQVGGEWTVIGTATTDKDGNANFELAHPAAGTYRVQFGGSPSLAATTSPELTVTAAPATTQSRYYVYKYRKDISAVLRVFADGPTYGITLGDMEYSCYVGNLAPSGLLTLTTFDFGGGTVTEQTTGGWKNMKIKGGTSKLSGNPKRTLTGKAKRYFRLCSGYYTYDQVATDENLL